MFTERQELAELEALRPCHDSGRAMTRAFRRRPVSFVTWDWIRSRACSYGFCDARSDTETGCSRVIISTVLHTDLQSYQKDKWTKPGSLQT